MAATAARLSRRARSHVVLPRAAPAKPGADHTPSTPPPQKTPRTQTPILKHTHPPHHLCVGQQLVVLCVVHLEGRVQVQLVQRGPLLGGQLLGVGAAPVTRRLWQLIGGGCGCCCGGGDVGVCWSGDGAASWDEDAAGAR